MKRVKVIFVVLSILLCNSLVIAITINVPGNQPTIQAGINAAANADTVLVQPGTYVENINYNGKDITVSSLFLTTQDTSYVSNTIIDGNANGTPVVSFNSAESHDAKLIGFTIQNGFTATGGLGAGIDIRFNSEPTLENLIIQNNISYSGAGGLHMYYAGTPIVKNTIFRYNFSSNMGGAIFGGDHLELSNCKFYGNSCNGGDGIPFFRPLSMC